jgi:hypothetical protein
VTDEQIRVTDVPVPDAWPRLDVPVPPMLENALGYFDPPRDAPPDLGLPPPALFVAFHWMCAGDEAYITDGRAGFDCDWPAYLAWKRHTAVACVLAPYERAEDEAARVDFGSSDSPPTHGFVLDRSRRLLYIAPIGDADRFLQRQWGVDPDEKHPPLRLDPDSDEYRSLLARGMAEVNVKRGWPVQTTVADYTHHSLRSQRLRAEMLRWIDSSPHGRAANAALKTLMQQWRNQ